MKTKLYFLLLVGLFFSACEEDFLTRQPFDRATDDTYWTNEENVRTFAWGFYQNFFWGYGEGYAWGSYFSGQSLNDDFAPTNPPQFPDDVPTSGGGWTFSLVRKANLMIERVRTVPMEEEALRHWIGVGRFFRAMEYADLVNSFGDVPWYGKVILEDETDLLYKPRDPRTLVMDSVLADFQYAIENVRESDGESGLTVNKYVVLAYMSRVFLFEGTWLKYHGIEPAKAEEYLEASKWASNELISAGNYTLADDYRSIFNSLDLSGNPELIMYRKYEEGMLTHSLNSYVNNEPQTGPSKNAIESYLCSDGLPISISPNYQGDKTIEDVMSDRDPRITETFVQELRLDGIAPNYSTSGYATHKFLNEDIKDQPIGSSSLNPTDAPVIRYGEILMNYAEACVELGSLTQEDLDKSINVLRSRPGIELPDLQVIGGQPAVNSIVYDDPARDPSVPALIWEIRRERRTELMMEGFRLDDLRRWKKLEKTDTKANLDINRGAWIKRADHPGLKEDVKIENDAAEGYIIPATKPETQRLFDDPRVYLSPLPIDQMKLYEDQGKELAQNPGW